MTPLTFLLHFYMTIFWKKLIFLGNFFYKLKFFEKKILIVTSLGVKVGMKLKMTPQTIFIAFLCDNFLQNLEFHVFLKHFPAKNIPRNKIIFCETFGKSLARLARLWKVSSCARLARLVKPNRDPIKYSCCISMRRETKDRRHR